MKQKVWILDDDKDIAEVLGLLLEMEGYNPVVHYSGRNALESIRRAKPGLVVLDVMLDGVDGRDICKQIKADPELKDIPVIMVSASVNQELIGNPDSFIAKPFHIEEIISRVNGFLKAA